MQYDHLKLQYFYRHISSNVIKDFSLIPNNFLFPLFRISFYLYFSNRPKNKYEKIFIDAELKAKILYRAICMKGFAKCIYQYLFSVNSIVYAPEI